ncbi:hypothetical protein ABID39_001528 [Bartonella japonica]|uniref:Uncharacterized protein n=1 Tax=Bartonella japonica TaxID=357761 RepID=A0ABV2FQF9_9HYPH
MEVCSSVKFAMLRELGLRQVIMKSKKVQRLADIIKKFKAYSDEAFDFIFSGHNAMSLGVVLLITKCPSEDSNFY